MARLLATNPVGKNRHSYASTNVTTAKAARLAAKAVDTNATAGQMVINFYG